MESRSPNAFFFRERTIWENTPGVTRDLHATNRLTVDCEIRLFLFFQESNINLKAQPICQGNQQITCTEQQECCRVPPSSQEHTTTVLQLGCPRVYIYIPVNRHTQTAHSPEFWNWRAAMKQGWSVWCCNWGCMTGSNECYLPLQTPRCQTSLILHPHCRKLEKQLRFLQDQQRALCWFNLHTFFGTSHFCPNQDLLQGSVAMPFTRWWTLWWTNCYKTFDFAFPFVLFKVNLKSSPIWGSKGNEVSPNG